VTLLSGGGSGHEPAHAGYVGHGMLTAAVAGAVFASPPPAAILGALRAIRSPAGSLMIVKNYTGDRLNFGIALERAKTEGMKVEMVIVGDDTALPSEGKLAGRRGLCGTILVHKIAGAAAEQGKSLEEVAAIAQRVADSVATMSVSLSPCSVPGLKPSFTLREDEMELGLGIHGEAGAERTKLQEANEVVKLMFKQMTRSDLGYQYFETVPGMEVALAVNNLGGTSNLELLIMTNAAIRYLVDEVKVAVVRVISGSLITSLEMAGVSLTLLKLTPELLPYLDAETLAPGWPRATVGRGGSRTRLDSDPVTCHSDSSPTAQDTRDKEPSTTIGRMMRSCVAEVCEVLIRNEERLNDLDRGSGDGDCGSTLTAGSTAIKERLSVMDWDNPRQVLLSLASVVENHMGGTSGALYSLFLTAGATADVSWSDSVSWATAMHAGVQAIMRYGGAERGHRTMIDALGPAVDVLRQGLPTATNTMEVLHSAVKGVRGPVPCRQLRKGQRGQSP
jgi:dihydroxyacetone kinase